MGKIPAGFLTSLYYVGWFRSSPRIQMQHVGYHLDELTRNNVVDLQKPIVEGAAHYVRDIGYISTEDCTPRRRFNAGVEC